jgi:hypothetical protein
MASRRVAYHTEFLHPTTTTAYTIATFTDTTLNSADDYFVTIDQGTEFSFVTAKSKTGFTVDITMPSPAEDVTVRVEFYAIINPIEPT